MEHDLSIIPDDESPSVCLELCRCGPALDDLGGAPAATGQPAASSYIPYNRVILIEAFLCARFINRIGNGTSGTAAIQKSHASLLLPPVWRQSPDLARLPRGSARRPCSYPRPPRRPLAPARRSPAEARPLTPAKPAAKRQRPMSRIVTFTSYRNAYEFQERRCATAGSA